ncbi:hypothetical protein [Acinetobacter piscicola]|uniref:hypothetical protein n=1 Tax=Acinetobacter piscicola TaxID=2006115 RepID=UPI00101EABA7|nr:hypothetical protein [Acinetobacter piscicola]RYL25115.1 hypothetical protein EWP19_13120 [Acinetobacter piscicola]
MRYLALALLIIPIGGFATDVHKCIANGKTTYQSKPCPNTGKTIGQEMREREALERKKHEEQQRLNAASQPSVSKSEFRTMDFSSCKRTVLATQISVSPQYKTSVIVNAPNNYIARICTNDGSVLMTCSGQDKKMILTKSSYCPL